MRLRNIMKTKVSPSISSEKHIQRAHIACKIIALSLCTFGLALTSACDSKRGKNSVSGGKLNIGRPACTGSQALHAQQDACIDCPENHFPNFDRSACVSTCPKGEIKADNKPTCETIVSCDAPKIHNPMDNTCMEKQCGTGEITDTTASPSLCITASACRATSGKFVSTDGETCISQSACISVSGRVATSDGVCQACSGENSIRNMEKTACLSISQCQTDSAGAFSVLDGAECITDADCIATPGRVATSDGVCQACSGETSIRNMEKTACLSISQCQTDSAGAFSVLDGAECITDADCIATPGRVATNDGVCQACSGETSIRNMEKTACLSISQCQTDSAGAFSVLDGAECITDADCIATPGRVATSDGVCQACSGETSIRNMEKTACLSISQCQTDSAGAFSVLDGAECITDADCIATPGRVATSDGLCHACSGETSIRNMEKTACLSISQCQTDSAGAFSVLDGAECITDADCIATPGRVATSDGVCQACSGENSIRNMEKTACLSISQCQTDSAGAFSVLDGAECITDADCIAAPGRVATSDGVCQQCEGATPLPNVPRGICDADSDSDGILNSDDAFPTDACASTDTDGDTKPDQLALGCSGSSLMEDDDDDGDGIVDRNDSCPVGILHAATTANPNAASADPDNDGCKNEEDMDDDGDSVPDAMDVDDDNDGLIEIATAQELSHMRHNLAGTTYDDEAADTDTGDAGSTTGAPIAPTTSCNTLTGGVYLCGYELVADIDFAGSDGDPATTDDNIDLNGNTAGNIDPIGSNSNRFTAQLHGNGHRISNAYIDRITGVSAANDETNDAALLASCASTNITSLTLRAPKIKGRRYVAALCGSVRSSTISNVHVEDGSIQGDSDSSFAVSMGALAAYANHAQITGSSASGSVSNGGHGNDSMGALVAYASNNTRITDSRSSANVSGGENGNDRMGALVGYANHIQIIGSSSSANVSRGQGGQDNMGGLVGRAENNVQIIRSRSSSNVSGGGNDTDEMGGLVGYMADSQIIGSRNSANISNGGGAGDRMGGLVGYMTSSRIIGSRSSANISDGGGAGDRMGGLVGSAVAQSSIIGSSSSGDISNSVRGNAYMGGLVGHLGWTNLRDSFSSSSVGEDSDTGSLSDDKTGALIGSLYGEVISNTDPARRFQIRNCMAVGLTRSNAGDETGFIGFIENGNDAKLNMSITNNRFDTTTTGLSAAATVGTAPSDVTLSNLTGMIGAGTTAMQPATAWLDTDTDADNMNDSSSWLATRWLFAAGAYPRLLYFDFDPSNPTTENPSSASAIDLCETITDVDSGITNDPLVDEGEAGKPDCGDVLEAWPRPADALFHPVPSDLELRENTDGSTTPVAIGSPVTAYDDNLDAITYSLKAGAPEGYAIDSASGQLSYTGSGVDFERRQTQSLTVIAASIGADGTETEVEQAVTIRIVDVAD